jgi:hypothetical protein
MNFTVASKITRQAPGKLTINTGENILFHVRYDDKTEIKKSDGSPGTAKDLHVGLVVRVEGELTEAGEIIAVKIEIQGEGGDNDPKKTFKHRSRLCASPTGVAPLR